MNQELIHVYFMPGMAASSSIFEYIKLPENKFKMHYLEWVIPHLEESIADYAKRMNDNIDYDNVVLIGVSFGGILVQEMSKHLKLRKLIIISSVKTRYELPKRMKLSRKIKLYKLAPTYLMSNVEVLAKYVFGKTHKCFLKKNGGYTFQKIEHFHFFQILRYENIC